MATTIWQDLKALDWEAESYPQMQDFMLVPFFAMLFPSIRFLLDRLIFEPLGRFFVCSSAEGSLSKKLSDTEKEALVKTLVKFKESAWKCVYYLSAEIFSLTITYNEPWFTNTKYFWVGPGDQTWPDQKSKLKLKILYAFAAGFYTYSIFALVFWETRRKDFGVSMSHHVATVALIVFSYQARFARIGSVVLALHDASDVFLEVAKLSKYSGSEIIPSIAFLLFALSWVILRLLFFPLWVIYSTSYEVLSLVDQSKYGNGPLLYYLFNTLLISLLVLHIYWWILIYRMILRQIQARGNIEKDVRSDSEDEKED